MGRQRGVGVGQVDHGDLGQPVLEELCKLLCPGDRVGVVPLPALDRRVDLSSVDLEVREEQKDRGGKGKEGKGREGKGRKGKGREGKGREAKGRGWEFQTSLIISAVGRRDAS